MAAYLGPALWRATFRSLALKLQELQRPSSRQTLRQYGKSHDAEGPHEDVLPIRHVGRQRERERQRQGATQPCPPKKKLLRQRDAPARAGKRQPERVDSRRPSEQRERDDRHDRQRPARRRFAEREANEQKDK